MGRIRHLRSVAAALALLFCVGATAQAQTRAQKARKAQTLAAEGLSTARAALVEATEEYKNGTREMIRLKEEELKRAEAKHEQLKGLVADGLVARRELEVSDEALASTRKALEGLRQQLVDSDYLIAEVREAEEAEKLAQVKARELEKTLAANKARLSLTARTSTAGGVVIRHAGGSGWTVANLPSVQGFFIGAFGRPLPTSAVGQTATHDRMGFAHHRAVDVALHPDSAEGRALIGYLRANGIPFIAFRAAVPGSATGPHIHIGPPSHRL